MNEEQIKQQFLQETQSALSNKKWLAVGAGILILGLFSTIAVSAFMAGLALAGLAAVGTTLAVASIYTYTRFPLWIQKIQNDVIESKHREMLSHIANLKNNARLNPIEQMEATYNDKRARVDILRKEVINLNSATSTMARKINEAKKNKPNSNLSEQEAQVSKMRGYVALRESQISEAEQALLLFKDNIDEAKVKWELKVIANNAIAQMNASDKNIVMNELLTETAFDEVDKSLDMLFAKIDSETNSRATSFTNLNLNSTSTSQSNQQLIEDVTVSNSRTKSYSSSNNYDTADYEVVNRSSSYNDNYSGGSDGSSSSSD